MELDPVLLSRLQFVWVVAWHILLPAFTVGLASFIAVLEGVHLATGRDIYLRVSQFWIRIFAVSFGLGVVSGIVMPFQFGTNWSRFSDAAANIISPLLAYEGLTAFFLEAAFLGVLLFGRRMVPPWAHFIAALMVAAGTLFSTFWILATNSWMQTPAGYEIVDGRFFPVSWVESDLQPLLPLPVGAHGRRILCHDRLCRVRRRRLHDPARCISARRPPDDADGIVAAELSGAGADVDRRSARPQHSRTPAGQAGRHRGPLGNGARVPLTLFAIPDQEAATNLAAVDVPVLGSLILTHDPNGTVRGLKEWPPDERPPVAIVFFAFRIMVGSALIMLAIVIVGSGALLPSAPVRDGLVPAPVQLAMPLGFIAVLAGWTTTEVGRQPWTIYGHLRTANSVSPSLTGGQVLFSLLCYMVVYLIIYPMALWFMLRFVREGPEAAVTERAPVESGRPAAPVSALPPDR